MNPKAQDQLALLREKGGNGAELKERVQRELRQLSDAIRAADGEKWFQVMPGREWSPAQEAEHIVMVNESTAKVIRLLLSDRELRQGPEVEVEYRPDGRRLAPAHTVGAGTATAQELLARNEALSQALDVDITEPSDRTFFHPAYGQISALDWLRIVPVHTRGHRKGIQAGIA